MADLKLVHDGEPVSRDDDEAELRALALAKAHYCIEDIATDAERDPIWVVETLYRHRAAFGPETTN